MVGVSVPHALPVQLVPLRLQVTAVVVAFDTLAVIVTGSVG